MTEYQKWIQEQPDSFKREILKDKDVVSKHFIDEKYKPITLEELKELDSKHNS